RSPLSLYARQRFLNASAYSSLVRCFSPMTAVHVRISTLSSSVSPEHRAQSLSRDGAAAVPAISRIAARPKIGTDCRTTRELRTIGKVSRRRASLDVAGYWYQAGQG